MKSQMCTWTRVDQQMNEDCTEGWMDKPNVCVDEQLLERLSRRAV